MSGRQIKLPPEKTDLVVFVDELEFFMSHLTLNPEQIRQVFAGIDLVKSYLLQEPLEPAEGWEVSCCLLGEECVVLSHTDEQVQTGLFRAAMALEAAYSMLRCPDRKGTHLMPLSESV